MTENGCKTNWHCRDILPQSSPDLAVFANIARVWPSSEKTMRAVCAAINMNCYISWNMAFTAALNGKSVE